MRWRPEAEGQGTTRASRSAWFDLGMPILLSPRCVTKAEAAEPCGITPGQFIRGTKLGLVPGPLRGTQRCLVSEIDSFLGRVNSCADPLKETDHYQQWKMRRDR